MTVTLAICCLIVVYSPYKSQPSITTISPVHDKPPLHILHPHCLYLHLLLSLCPSRSLVVCWCCCVPSPPVHVRHHLLSNTPLCCHRPGSGTTTNISRGGALSSLLISVDGERNKEGGGGVMAWILARRSIVVVVVVDGGWHTQLLPVMHSPWRPQAGTSGRASAWLFSWWKESPPPRFNAGEVYLSAEEEYTMIFIMFMGLHATYHIARGLRTTRV